jgi:uncharacterized protein DUF2809
MTPRALTRSLALMAATVALGLALRFAPLGLPRALVKYGGSTMWALMIYWIVSTLLPRLHPVIAAVISGAIATAVEFFKLYHSPGMDAFRHTLPGVLLLGRHFSVRDIAAYWIAICLGSWVDTSLRKREHQGAGTAAK